MKRLFPLTAAAVGFLSCVSSAAFAVSLTQPGASEAGVVPSVPQVLVQPGVCEAFAVHAAYIAVEGPNGVTTVPMTQVGANAFQIQRQADWPTSGHIRLQWAPVANAPGNVLSAVDVGSDPVLLDGVPVAEAFLGSMVATAIQDVSLDPSTWPHVVALQVGAVPAGSNCSALTAVPATLTVLPHQNGGPVLNPGLILQNGQIQVR